MSAATLVWAWWPSVLVVALCGCGTTHTTDTSRTATEQLLISDAVDRAVQSIDFRPLAGQAVFLDESYLTGVVDRAYLVSTIRQHLLASGCVISDRRDEATFVIEARSGAVGTNRDEVLFGIPSINVPSFVSFTGLPSSIPEIPIVKKTARKGVAKLAVFAYHQETGAPVWQSGIAQNNSSARDTWVLGAGPFQRGTIYEGTVFAGSKIKINPLKNQDVSDEQQVVVQSWRAGDVSTTTPEAPQDSRQ